MTAADDRIDEALELKASGLNARQIGERMGISKVTVQKIFRDLKRSGQITESELVAQMVDAGGFCVGMRVRPNASYPYGGGMEGAVTAMPVDASKPYVFVKWDGSDGASKFAKGYLDRASGQGTRQKQEQK